MRASKYLGASLALALLIGGAVTLTGAQDASAPHSTQNAQAEAPPNAYRLDYTLTELQAGKKVDARQYSVNIGAEGRERAMGRIQIGTRVPVSTKADGTVDYLSVQTTISGTLYMRDGVQVLDTVCDVSSVAPDKTGFGGHPILRTLTINNSTPLVEGKPVLVGTADDPNSDREFQLEVKVTELK